MTFILDVDGVLTNGKFLYDSKGKKYKEFGPDDSDALKLLSEYVQIIFVSQDNRGYSISKKRVNDMGFSLFNVKSENRVKYISDNFGLDNSIYMGDSFVDAPILKSCKYGICTMDSDPLAKKYSTFITSRPGGSRAVSEACFWIAQNILNLTPEEFTGMM